MRSCCFFYSAGNQTQGLYMSDQHLTLSHTSNLPMWRFTEMWHIPSSPSLSETLLCLSCFRHDLEAPGPSPISFWGSLSTGYLRSRNIWNQLAILSQTGHHNFLSVLSDYGIYNVDSPRLGITISRSSLVTIAYITLTMNLTIHSRSSDSPMKRSALQLFHRWVDWGTGRLDCKLSHLSFSSLV